MPQPYTVQNPATGAPLLTVDSAGNVTAAGGVQGYGTTGGGIVGAPAWPPPHGDVLVNGELTIPRAATPSSVTLTGGQVALTYFTAQKTATSMGVQTGTGGTAASGLTAAYIGAYASDNLGNLTLVASTANTTSLWGATFTIYQTAWQQAWARTVGQRYALAVLAVGTTMPALNGLFTTLGTWAALAPPIAQSVSAGSLPATIAAGILAGAPGFMVEALI